MQKGSQYNPKEIEPKWIKKWAETGIYKTPEDATKENKYYILPQLPYPSGSGLHVGHTEIYIGCDILARFKRMKGDKVLQVMGWDAFGLPAENYAVKTNVHPRINTDKAIENYKSQLVKIGASYDWDREVGSHNPDYYKWTQWFFLLMYNQGLAYRKNQKVNWCPSCKTVLANEQVEEKDGVETCERCDSEVEHKMMEQWYLKITDYADRLAADLDKIDWPKETVKRQKDWIGRSEGIEIDFDVVGQEDHKVTCFTTTPVNFGATFIVVAPEYEHLDKLITDGQREKVEEYVKIANAKSELDRQKDEKTKTGVFTGSYAKNHLTGEEIPIWVADFVLASFGTGAVQGCPAHYERDFEFSKKFDIPIIRVVEGKNGETDKYVDPEKEEVDQVKIGVGIKRKMVNSEMFNDLPFDEGMEKTKDYFEKKGWGRRVVTYKLRDWSVSRQRFWGAPIPMLHRSGVGSEIEKFSGKPSGILFAHSWFADSKSHFYPWLMEQLSERGVKVEIPDMPDAQELPEREKWVAEFKQAGKGIDLANAVVAGHSLGSWTALQFAEGNKIRKL
ncbi:leucine--tRNA ligase, partial [Candidatus Dojkabacteria bacterium]|nr:leucine--tRNA ligase [Candidatus Dojkabacteria bacterium]